MRSLSELIEAVRGIGLANVLAAARYTVWKGRLEGRQRRGTGGSSSIGDGAEGWVSTGRPVAMLRTERGARFTFEDAVMDLDFLATDLVRVAWEPDLPPGNGKSPLKTPAPIPYALAKGLGAWAPVPLDVAGRPEGGSRADGDSWVLRTVDLEVRLNRADGVLSFFDSQGRLLREEWPPSWRGEESRHVARLVGGERIYGLGERAAPLNLRGTACTLWNRDPGGAYGPGTDPLYLNIPTYLGLHALGSYLVFYENYWPAVFDLGASRPNLAEHRFAGGPFVHYFIPGPLDRALERYTELTGRPPMPPLWAFGYHQSRWSYYPAERVRRLAADFERHGVPVDVIHLDIDYMDGFRVFTWDRTRFPDLPALAGELRQAGLRLVTILDPGVKRDRGYAIYRDGLAQNVFCRLPDGRPVFAPVWPGWCAFPDFTDPRARAWWGSLYPALLDAGVAGFWHDMNEPAAFVGWGDPTLPAVTRHAMEGRGGDHRQGHNLYGLLMARAGYEALRALRPEGRPFVLTRSGWAGIQRYAWNWTGDVRSDWASLGQVGPTILGLGLSGQAFTGSDIGGFSGSTTPELFVRWLQLGAFTPLCRAHTVQGSPDQEPWSFGEPYLTIAREFIRLRYALLPYLYTLAWEAHKHGWPMVRPLFWPGGEPGDRPAPGAERLLDVGDSFLLGDNLLVAPVIEPGATGRPVELPPGDWYGFWDDALHAGPGSIRAAVSLERIPIFVRAGSILPMEPPAMGTAKRKGDKLFLHLYVPPRDGAWTSTIYSDAGEGYGASRVDRFRARRQGGRLTIEREVAGEYPWPYSETELVVHGLRPARALIDGVERDFEIDLPGVGLGAPGLVGPGPNAPGLGGLGGFRQVILEWR